MIPQDTVNKILDAAQIVDVVSDFVSLKRRGANFVACCPFHNEKTPSFYVSPSKGIYKCFGCGKSGSAVGFVMEHENLSYSEALKYLAKKYGIPVIEKEESAEDIAKRQRSESLLLVSEFAHKFFVSSLDTDEGRTIGKAYFRSRGLEEETIRKYGLGWAPRDRQALCKEALAKGYKEEYLVDAGLVIKYDDGHLADRFFDRVMFPVHSVSGRVIAFGGRTLRSDKTVAKYVNSPETEIYDKSRSLYGIWFAKGEMSRQDKCFLVEGYLDVLSMHQLGIQNVVASSGTSLTVPQIRLIKKFTENVTIMYDGDSAGIKAAIRGIGLVLKEGLNVKVVLLPDGDDPDSYSRKHSLEEVQSFIAANEQDFIEFKTELLLGEARGDPLKKANLINDIADTIALIPDAVKRSVYAQASADKFDIDSGILFSRIRRTREKMIEDDRKAAERERSRSSAGSLAPDIPGPQDVPLPDYEDTPSYQDEPAAPGLQGFEYPSLAASEKDLLTFILRHGRTLLEFESDSDFYSPDGQYSVADFIRDCLEADGFSMENTAYRRLYDSYFNLYDADDNYSQEEIIRIMLNGPDRISADMVADITQEKHMLSVRSFEAAMTAQATMLVTYVPRAIQVYQLKRIDVEVNNLNRKLKDAPEEEMLPILGQIQEYIGLRKKLEEELGRVM
ncbi:MAG: DNA primase [Bacteroidales bacterium]|nr:DNA primase [Bacteroidales bacterium]